MFGIGKENLAVARFSLFLFLLFAGDFIEQFGAEHFQQFQYADQADGDVNQSDQEEQVDFIENAADHVESEDTDNNPCRCAGCHDKGGVFVEEVQDFLHELSPNIKYCIFAVAKIGLDPRCANSFQEWPRG